MNNDSYKIILSLSHRRISFEYWLRDGEKGLVPMPHGNWPAPLAFYCSQTGIQIGEDAARAAKSGTANAFDNYFERLSDGETYSYGGQRKPLGNLLLDAAETVFRDFYCDILFNRYGSLVENRANMPLTIVCEADIESNERAYLTSLFKDCGYVRMKVTDYDSYIERYIRETMSKDYTSNQFLIAWTEGINLILTSFKIGSNSSKHSKIFKGLGVDPRLEYVKGLIWADIIGQNAWLSKEAEALVVEKVASDFLNSTKPMVSDRITLSDGEKYKYSLNRTNIDFIQSKEGIELRKGLDSFCKEIGVTNKSNITLLLRGVAAGNTYFEQNLSHGFAQTIRCDDKLRAKTMNLLIEEQTPCAVTVNEPPQEPEPIKEIQEVQPPQVNIDQIKSLERKWREIKATAKGKVRAKNFSEANEVLTNFLNECSKIVGTSELIEKINVEIAAIPKHASAVSQAPNNTTKPRNAGAPQNIGKVQSNVVKTDRPAKVKEIGNTDDGLEYIKQWKVKEARDWYRDKGDNSKSRMLSEIIRSKKGIDLRKNTIDDCRKNKNAEQINRIINELSDFIDLCDKVGLPAADYKKLLSDYRKIK
jgi:hypothetical protein